MILRGKEAEFNRTVIKGFKNGNRIFIIIDIKGGNKYSY